MDPNAGYYQAPPMNPRQSRFSPKVLLIGIGALLAIIIAGVMLMASGDGDVKTLYTRAVARETALYTMAGDAQNKLAHPDLRKLNADAQLLFGSNVQTLTKGMVAYGVKSVPKDIEALEADGASAKRLNQAHQENRFDETYASVLKQKIDAQQALLQELHDNARSAVKPDLEAAYDNLQALQESLKGINI